MHSAFLKRVWGDGEGWVCLAWLLSGKFTQRFYRYPDQFDKILKEVEKQNELACVYFCPHLLSEPRRQKDAAFHQICALWIDKDKGLPEEIHPRPTICWVTSEGRHQAVWLLTKPMSPEAAEHVNRWLTYVGKGDKGGWHLGKVIRIPGSTNHKYAPPFQGYVLWDDGPTYDPKQLKPDSDFLASGAAQISHCPPTSPA